MDDVDDDDESRNAFVEVYRHAEIKITSTRNNNAGGSGIDVYHQIAQGRKGGGQRSKSDGGRVIKVSILRDKTSDKRARAGCSLVLAPRRKIFYFSAPRKSLRPCNKNHVGREEEKEDSRSQTTRFADASSSATMNGREERALRS